MMYSVRFWFFFLTCSSFLSYSSTAACCAVIAAVSCFPVNAREEAVFPGSFILSPVKEDGVIVSSLLDFFFLFRLLSRSGCLLRGR